MSAWSGSPGRRLDVPAHRAGQPLSTPTSTPAQHSRSALPEETTMTYPTDRPATWFVTGASRGLGLELVRQLLRRGDNVAATTRSTERLTGALDGIDTSRLLPLAVDLADEAQVSRSEEHTSELQSPCNLVCRLLLEE